MIGGVFVSHGDTRFCFSTREELHDSVIYILLLIMLITLIFIYLFISKIDGCDLFEVLPRRIFFLSCQSQWKFCVKFYKYKKA